MTQKVGWTMYKCLRFFFRLREREGEQDKGKEKNISEKKESKGERVRERE